MKILSYLLFFGLCWNASAYYHDTLPVGVRMFLYKNVKTTQVQSKFGANGKEVNFNFELDASTKELEALENEYVDAFLDLYKQYPDAYQELSLGHFKASAEANVEVDAYAFAIGLNNRLTAYAALPFYKAKVDMQFKRPKKSTFDKVAEVLQGNVNDDYAQSLGNITKNFYDLDGELLQSVIVNNYNYHELGPWEGSGPGDLEFGFLYNLVKEPKYGFLLTVGGVAPTGYVDDPDIIQDIGFGDGQWDAFVEFGGDYGLTNWFSTFAWSRFTYQFASEKELRIPTSKNNPLSAEKGTFQEKLGNTLLTCIGTDVTINDWTALKLEYLDYRREKAQYNSKYEDANEYLAYNTDSSKRTFRSTLSLSSITPFLKKKFILPATVKFQYEKILEGTNTPKADLYGFEFQMLF